MCFMMGTTTGVCKGARQPLPGNARLAGISGRYVRGHCERSEAISWQRVRCLTHDKIASLRSQ